MKVQFRAAVAVLASIGCGTTLVPVRPSEPITATSANQALQVTVDGIWITDELADRGMADEQAIAVQLSVTNRGREPRQLSPAAFACLMVLDAQKPEQTLSLVASGGGDGPFPGQVPDEGSLLASVTVAPGETRSLWALFSGYRYPGSDVPRRIVLEIPGDDGRPLELVLADPARGALRWELPPKRAPYVVGLGSGALFGGVTGQAVTTELSRVWRMGALMWEVGLVTTTLIQRKGPLQSQTSAFTGSGIAARLTMPMLGWGTTLDPRQLGLYAGASASVLLEIIGDRAPDDMTPPSVYGAIMAEAGVQLDVGALRFAGTPFPLAPSGRLPLPRWSIRLGYTHAWIGGAQADGYVSSLRLTW